jgi:hypothetical protein
MSDDRSEFGDDYNSITSQINKIYADKWKYDFRYIKVDKCFSNKEEERHSSWAKLISIKKVILENKWDIIVYIDSDCIFKNHDLTIKDYLKSVKNINNQDLKERYITFLNDIPWSDKLPCAGFFIIKTKLKKHHIIDDWFDSDFPNYNMKHTWEQYALHNRIMSLYKDDIEIINDVMFLEQSNQFLRHIGSHEKHNRINYFKKMLNNIK